MSRSLYLAAACLVVAGAVPLTPLRAEDAKDLKPKTKILMGHGPLAYRPQTLVIGSAEALVANSSQPTKAKDREVQREMSAALARFFDVPAIDWDKQMVVGIMTGGGRGDAGRLAFNAFVLRGTSLTVYYTGPAYPEHTCTTNSGLALVPRCGGEVRFVEGDAPK